jgi:signal transduction histidine kinase
MIFEPFWRKYDRTPGMSLVLSIVKELVAARDGTISVEPTPSGGTPFKTLLQQSNPG